MQSNFIPQCPIWERNPNLPATPKPPPLPMQQIERIVGKYLCTGSSTSAIDIASLALFLHLYTGSLKVPHLLAVSRVSSGYIPWPNDRWTVTIVGHGDEFKAQDITGATCNSCFTMTGAQWEQCEVKRCTFTCVAAAAAKISLDWFSRAFSFAAAWISSSTREFTSSIYEWHTHTQNERSLNGLTVD